MVDLGFGEVKAKTRAAAIASAKTLNSATGVTCMLISVWVTALWHGRSRVGAHW